MNFHDLYLNRIQETSNEASTSGGRILSVQVQAIAPDIATSYRQVSNLNDTNYEAPTTEVGSIFATEGSIGLVGVANI